MSLVSLEQVKFEPVIGAGISAIASATKDPYQTYTDFGFVLASREIEIAQPKLDKLSVPYMDGEYDFTGAFNDKVTYSRRNITLNFIYLNNNAKPFDIAVQQLATLIHGKVCNVYINSSSVYYTGRVSINKIACDRIKGTMRIDIDAEPYKSNGRLA